MARHNGKHIDHNLDAAPLSRGDADGNRGFGWLFVQDERDFKQMLSDWMVAVGCSPEKDNQAFLDKTGLAPFLSTDNLQALLDGTKAPGRKLINHLAVLLPDEDERRKENLPTPLVFRRRGLKAHYDAQEKGEPVLELTDEQCHALRKPLIERLCATLVPYMPYQSDRPCQSGEEETETEVSNKSANPLTSKLLAYVRQSRSDVQEEEVLERMAAHWRRRPQEVMDLLRQALPEAQEPELEQWAREELQPLAFVEEYRGAGRLLRFLRECSGFTQDELAAKSGWRSQTVSAEERGELPIYYKRLQKYRKAFDLNEEEYRHLSYLRLPALNPEWLDRRPEEKRAGLLLRAYRQRAEFSQKEFGEKVANPQVIMRWETTRSNINRQKLPLICKTLGLSGEEEERLSSLVAIKESLRSASVRDALRASNHKRLEASGLSALDPEWLAAQPEEKHAGLLLQAYRMRAYLTRDELAGITGIVGATVGSWERSDSNIDPAALPRLKTSLNLDESEYRRLLYLCVPALNADWLAGQPVKRQAGLLLSALISLKGITYEDLAEKIGVRNQHVISHWTIAQSHIFADKLLALYEALDLANDKPSMFRLTRMVRPELAPEYIEKQLARDTVQYLAFPALDPEWLAAQPVKAQAGLLLRAYRERAGLLQKNLGEKVGGHQSHVSAWECASKSIGSQKLPLICAALGLSDEEVERLSSLMAARERLIASERPVKPPTIRDIKKCPDVVDLSALDPVWLESQPEGKRPGLLLRAYRLRAGLSQDELAEKVGVPYQTIGGEERGEYPVYYKRLPKLKEALGLSEEDYQRLLSLRFPALDPDWLAGQPEEKRAGRLLVALRERAGLEQGELAEKSGLNTQQCLGNWERGAFPIPGTKLFSFYKALSLETDKESALRLALLAVPDLGTEYIERQLARDTVEYISFPALDPEWRECYPKEKAGELAGLMLKALRERAELTQGQLAKEIGVSHMAVWTWECNAKLITHERAGQLIEFFSRNNPDWFDGQMAEGFREVCALSWQGREDHKTKERSCCAAKTPFPALDPEWLVTQPPEKQAGLMLAALSKRTGLSHEDIAERLGVNKASLWRWETGRSPILSKSNPKYVDRLVQIFRNSSSEEGKPHWFDDGMEQRFRGACALSYEADRKLSAMKNGSATTHMGAVKPEERKPRNFSVNPPSSPGYAAKSHRRIRDVLDKAPSDVPEAEREL